MTFANLINIAVSEDSCYSFNETNKSLAIPSINKATINEKVKLAETYLVNSYLDFNDINANYAVDRYFKKEFQLIQALQGIRDFSDYTRTNLPESIPLNMSFGQCVSTRRSIREFTGDFINLAHVATLLRASTGITGRVKINIRNETKFDSVYFRAAPSGGGLYSIALYIVPLNVKELPFSTYHYSPNKDALFKVLDSNDSNNIFSGFFEGKNEIENKRTSLLVLYVAAPWCSMQKYGARGLRFVFHELGAIAQNLNLASTALGLGSLDYASFSEDLINHSLGFDGVEKTVLHTSLIGIPG